MGTAADVYALGVCFFEMLADDLPRGPQSLKQLRREVPEDVDRVVVAMLSQEPGLRPTLATVRAVAAVENILSVRDGKPIRDNVVNREALA